LRDMRVPVLLSLLGVRGRHRRPGAGCSVRMQRASTSAGCVWRMRSPGTALSIRVSAAATAARRAASDRFGSHKFPDDCRCCWAVAQTGASARVPQTRRAAPAGAARHFLWP